MNKINFENYWINSMIISIERIDIDFIIIIISMIIKDDNDELEISFIIGIIGVKLDNISSLRVHLLI
jgi:hypothetical protein